AIVGSTSDRHARSPQRWAILWLAHLEGFEKFNQGHPVRFAKFCAEFMPGIRITGEARIEGKGACEGAARLDSDMNRVEFPASDIKHSRTSRRRQKQVVKIRNRTIVKI